jgi:pimeloyl-ACP methyl ester carboxylesterase
VTEPQSFWTNDKPRLHMLSWEGEGGTPLLLTHGMAGNAHWWDAVAPALAEDFRPVALDFHGHGDSEWTPDGLYGPELYVENMESARQVLGWPKMALLAHSMGARIALEYAARFPDRVSAIVAVDFLAGSFDSKTSRFERIKHRPQPVYSDPEIMADRFRLEPDASVLSKEELRAVARKSLRKVPRGYSWKFDWRAFIFKAGAAWERFAQIQAPALIVRGEHSTVMPLEEFEKVVDAIPGAKGVEIKKAHHHVPLDAPKELVKAVRSHLKGL